MVLVNKERGLTIEQFAGPHRQQRCRERNVTMKRDHILKYQGRGETVLVIDPDESVRNLLYEILKLNGYNVLSTDNAYEGERLYWMHQGRIDLVLADLWTSGLSTSLAKMLHFKPNLAVLFTTHYGAKRAKSALVDMMILEKPFDIVELFGALKISLYNKAAIAGGTSIHKQVSLD